LKTRNKLGIDAIKTHMGYVSSVDASQHSGTF